MLKILIVLIKQMKTLEERQKIKDSLVATRQRRKNQVLKVFELKVNCHQTSKETFEKMNFVFTQAKWMPTTKFCPNCGALNSIGLDERTYKCECGYQFDRDIHAAKNVKLFGPTKRAGCLEQASVESLASTVLKETFYATSQDAEAKNEDAPF